MKLTKMLAGGVAGFLGAWLIVCAIAGAFATNWALHPPRKPLTYDERQLASAVASRGNGILQNAVITALDGSELHGWFMQSQSGGKDAVMLLHGQADNRAGMLGTAEMFLRHGYSVLLPDARAQGASGGAEVTYGVKEEDDIRRWYRWLQESQRPNCIFGLGDSMGAADLLQSLKTVKQFCAIVAESPFASFREASYDRIGQWTGTGPWIGRTWLRPVVWFGLLYARMHYGDDLAASNPAQTVATAQVPVMLIHGLKDDNLPARHSEAIFRGAQGKNKNVILWEPLNAGHCGASTAEPLNYEQKVISWFVAHDRQPRHEPQSLQ